MNPPLGASPIPVLDTPAIPILDVSAWFSAGAVLAIAYLLGTVLTCRITQERAADAVMIRVAAGLAMVPVAVLLAGQVPGLLFVRGLWIAGAFAGVGMAVYHGWLARSRRAEGTGGEGGDGVDRLLGALGLILLGGVVAYFLGPLSSPPLNYDALEYHVGVIPHYFETRRVEPIPHVFYSAQPIATEMLYTLGAVIEGTPWGGSSGLVQWMLVALAALLLLRTLSAAGLGSGVAAALAVAFMAHPIILRLELDRMTDLTGAIFLLAGWLLWLRSIDERPAERRPRPLFFVMGVLAGGAITSKWTNAGTAAAALVAAPAVGMALGWKRAGATTSALRPDEEPFAGRGVAPAVAFACGAAAALTPWIGWVWIETGNPVAPFGASWFPTERWRPEQLGYLMGTHGVLSPLTGEYWARLMRRVMSERIGSWPLLLAAALAIAAWLRRRRTGATPTGAESPAAEREARWTVLIGGLLAVLAAWLLWGRLRHAADRFLAPTVAMEFVMLGAAAAWLVRGLEGRAKNAANAALFAFALIAASTGPLPLFGGAQVYWSRALGKSDAGTFLREGMGSTVGLFEAANALPEGSRILAIGEARRYYFRHPVTLASVFDRHPVAEYLTGPPTVEGLAARLREAGYTHLLVNEYETARLLDFHPPPTLERNAEFMELRRARAGGEMVRRYGGYSEFGARPLTAAQRGVYVQFLGWKRAEAVFLEHGPEEYPGFWIAPL